MGIVYAAEHIELGRTCAVKVIRECDDDAAAGGCDAVIVQDAVSRFRVEALAASRLDHPNVLRVLDFGREAGDGGDLWYLVTEHLDGEDLIDVLNAEAVLTMERTVDIARQLCSALAHAHNWGVVHRDVKPENVRLVRRDGEDGRPVETVKLLDFGTAHIEGETAASTLVIGTPAYMSPEQASGAVADARSDLYAVGVLMFEMATGRLPFERGSPVELAAAHVECRPPSPSSVNPEVDRELESIVLWCMRKRPAERPQSARALREALDRIALRSGRRRPTGTFAPYPAAHGDFGPGRGALATARSAGGPSRGRLASEGTTTVRELGALSHRVRRQRRAPTLLTLLGAAGLASAAWLVLGQGSAPKVEEAIAASAPGPAPAAPAPSSGPSSTPAEDGDEVEPRRAPAPGPIAPPAAPQSLPRRTAAAAPRPAGTGTGTLRRARGSRSGRRSHSETAVTKVTANIEQKAARAAPPSGGDVQRARELPALAAVPERDAPASADPATDGEAR